MMVVDSIWERWNDLVTLYETAFDGRGDGHDSRDNETYRKNFDYELHTRQQQHDARDAHEHDDDDDVP